MSPYRIASYSTLRRLVWYPLQDTTSCCTTSRPTAPYSYRMGGLLRVGDLLLKGDESLRQEPGFEANVWVRTADSWILPGSGGFSKSRRNPLRELGRPLHMAMDF